MIGDEGPAALEQVVLSNHWIGDGYFRTHGFWFNGWSNNSLGLQMPTGDPADLETAGLLPISSNASDALG